ncbi:hypothetical protein BDQ17DRAFT_1389151 [Cyathus striatus]|nr:hypothetical protein BDQ17DRAFT_1389151 [Cyathus striatus]
MPPSSHTTSLQIPPLESPPSSSSRHHHHNHQQYPSAPSSAGRPVSATVQQPTPPSASVSSRRQQRGASHQVVSPSLHAAAADHSHNDDSTPNQMSPSTPYPDVYNHPAALQYIESHPRRTIPKFGPYLLLQTLGEGEFGKVKLGLHSQWGEEVAVKLIRRGNVDNSTRMSKVEREIEVLRSLKHPNIVRLYDVIETDKYIGIILEYASGGELFDHILAHRYLRERDAQKLFHQLISGVWYIHQKKIVHRDLKLENLLLDRNRNVLITDFGFANRFEHRADDLMQTSCGSPCYAAPELVISEGLYVGSAVDIWSCGVILYAMLAGYLPFDDDPANPDGDNINLLYRYIVNTPLTFPEYITPGARDLLGIMLVPDPTRRASLDTVMRHAWLSEYVNPRRDGKPNAFGKTVEDLEKSAMDLHHQKRVAYQKQLKKDAQAAREAAQASQQQQQQQQGRSQSNRVEARATTTVLPSAGRSTSVQPELYYESNSADQSLLTSPAPAGSATPTQQQKKQHGSPAALGLSEDDPFAAPGSAVSNVVVTTTTTTTTSKGRTSEERNGLAPAQAQPQSPAKQGHKSGGSGGGGFRHTIQVEYDAPANSGSRRSRDRSGSHGQQQQQEQPPPQQPQQPSPPREQKRVNGVQPNGVSSPVQAVSSTPVKERRPSQSNGSTKPLPPNPNVANTPSSYKPPGSAGAAPPAPTTPKVTPPTPKQSPRGAPDINVSSPPPDEKETASQSSGSGGKRGHQRARSSVDKFTLTKIFGSSNSSSVPSPISPSASHAQDGTMTPSVNGSMSINGRNDSASVLLSPVSADKESNKSGGKEKEGRKSRRNTLTEHDQGRSAKSKTATTPVTANGKKSATSASTLPPPPSAFPSSSQGSASASPSFANAELDMPSKGSLPASTPKAKSVMGWFRSRSKGHDPASEADKEKDVSPNDEYKRGWSASNTAVNQPPPASAKELSPHVVVTTPRSASSTRPPLTPQRAASDAPSTPTATPSLMTRFRFRNSVTVGGIDSSRHDTHQQQQPKFPHDKLRVHHGAVDQAMITTKSPQDVMKIVREVLEGMGIEILVESEYKYRCIRAKRKKATVAPVAGSVASGGLAAVTMVGSAASNGVDKRGLPLPPPSTFSSTGGMLRGLLMRRQSSQAPSNISQPSLAFDDETSVMVSEPAGLNGTTLYGEDKEDVGDEVRFYVELTRIGGLNDTYSLDPRRLKGNLRSYKFLYDTLRQRANLAG